MGIGKEVEKMPVAFETDLGCCELLHRQDSQLDVTILFDSYLSQVYLAVKDIVENVQQIVPIPNDRVMDAFHHPFCYIVR